MKNVNETVVAYFKGMPNIMQCKCVFTHAQVLCVCVCACMHTDAYAYPYMDTQIYFMYSCTL
jgi:hypothetical protein